MSMSEEQARIIIDQMYQSFVGTIKEHQTIQEAMKVLFDKENKED